MRTSKKWYLLENACERAIFIWKLLFFGPVSARSYKIGVVGNNWLVGWLVGIAVFSETVLSNIRIFCMKLGDYKGRKVTEPDFWKKFLIWRYSRKGLQISPKSDTLISFTNSRREKQNHCITWVLFCRRDFFCHLKSSKLSK